MSTDAVLLMGAKNRLDGMSECPGRLFWAFACRYYAGRLIGKYC